MKNKTSNSQLTSSSAHQLTTLSAFFTPGNDCLNAIIYHIAHAKKSIDICVFTISDDRISRAILYAHRKGIKVRILTDNDKSEDRGSDIDQLARYGIEVRMDNSDQHMHHKFAIFDDRLILTGSFNWTRSASERNYENIVAIENNELTKQFINEFEGLWRGNSSLAH